jgi:hypothetical protein
MFARAWLSFAQRIFTDTNNTFIIEKWQRA